MRNGYAYSVKFPFCEKIGEIFFRRGHQSVVVPEKGMYERGMTMPEGHSDKSVFHFYIISE